MQRALEGKQLGGTSPPVPAARRVSLVVLFALAYFATGQVGLVVQMGHTGVTPVWLPSGVSLFVFVVYGVRMWPGLALGLGMLALHNDVPLVACLISFLGQLSEALLGRHFMQRPRLERHLESSSDVLRFSVLVALVPSMASALIGTSGMVLGGAEPASVSSMWLQWWLGDAAGIMVVAPLLLAWSSGTRERITSAGVVELVVLLVVLSALGWYTFGAPPEIAAHSPPIFYLLLPLTIRAAIRFGPQGASLTSAVACGWLLWGAARGAGPFSLIGGLDTVLSEVGFIVVTTGLSLAVSALFRERMRAEEMLRRSGLRLEARVKERTTDLEAAKEQALAASRAKSRFLADVSHELRTPMNGVIGFTNLLMRTELGEQQRDYVETIRRSAGDLLVVINDLLDLSRIESSRIQIRRIPCGVQECIDDVIALLEPSARDRGLTLTRHIDDDVPPRLIGDPVRVRQVLINLVANAIKFTESGSVEIRIARVCPNRPEGAPLSLRFSVKDSGPGLSVEDQRELFQAFHRFKSSANGSSGTGLGLAISKSLVELMGGAIGVQSAPGVGSTFWFDVPVEHAAAGASEVHVEEASAAFSPRPRAKVLVADDSATNRKLMGFLLASAGIDTAEAEDGEQVVAMMAARRFDLVLMDIRMPGIDGIEATRRIRTMDDERRHTPIVALTAHALPDEREEFILAGMDDCLTKPISEAELWRVLARYVGEARPNGGAVAPFRHPASDNDPRTVPDDETAPLHGPPAATSSSTNDLLNRG